MQSKPLAKSESVTLPNRRVSETESVGPFDVTVSFVDDKPVEVFLTGRGKTGHDLDDILYELGVRASKIMQREE